LFGVAVLAGIGFTMSLFIGMLAFPETERAVDVRIGVLMGSICAAVVGYLILANARPPQVATRAR
jgi:NhaA family Na+:H+ antiporter